MVRISKEIKNVAVNRATNKIQGALGQLSSLWYGLVKSGRVVF